MRILVLGGTIFVGRHIVDAAIRNGHDVTLFNRGQTNREVFKDITTNIIGDRRKDLSKLRGKCWDVVIDTSAYVPKDMRASCLDLQSACDYYVFVSTGAVYKNKTQEALNEDDEILSPEDSDADEMTDSTYGELKAGCETELANLFNGSTLVVRPGIVVGPYDPTDRFTYWVVRIARGGKVLAPGNPNGPIQFIDARDLADWMISMIERRQIGIYNAVGPDHRLAMSEFFNECKCQSASDAQFVWIPDERLQTAGVNCSTDLPLWMPSNSDSVGLYVRSNKKAISKGLTFRPLATTVTDTLSWWRTERLDSELKVGLTPDREAELLRMLTKTLS